MRAHTGAIALAAVLAMALSVARPHQYPPPGFDALSIKEVNAISGHTDVLSVSGANVKFEGYNIENLIAEAFQIKRYQITFANRAADWRVFGTWWEIDALASDGATPSREQARAMLRWVLTNRYSLVSHRESKPIPAYDLEVDEGGPKFRASQSSDACKFRVTKAAGGQRLDFTNCSLDYVAGQLGEVGILGRNIVRDRTGLSGVYDMSYVATPRFPQRADRDPAAVDPFTALEILGLKAVPSREPIDILVVDNVTPPTSWY